MSSARLRRRGKQVDELAQENVRLHQDVEELETALFLHERTREEDENNVRGLIRKEVGGARWEHGGAGKLLSYKSSKDLKEQLLSQNRKQPATKSAKAMSQGQISSTSVDKTFTNHAVNTTNMQSLELNGENASLVGSLKKTSKSDKIMDLKSKVLHKASLKIIKRDNWPSLFEGGGVSETHEQENIAVKADQSLTKQTKKKPDSYKSVQDKVTKATNKSDSVLNKTYKLEHNQSEITSRKIESQQNCKKTYTGNKDNRGKIKNSKNADKDSKDNNATTGNRRSRLDIYESGNSKHKQSESSNVMDEIESETVPDESSLLNEWKESDLVVKPNSQPEPEMVDKPNISTKQEVTEIYIDPENFQVRIKSGVNEVLGDYSDLGARTVVIESGVAAQKAASSEKLPCSVVDTAIVNTQTEVRDIFGLTSLDTNQNTTFSQSSPSTTLHVNTPILPAKKCDSEVEFWLRGLNLPDVEKYVTIFAENEIDLLDLEFMSASQLHEMGVTCLGALNTIVHGIKDLRKRPVPKEKGEQDATSKHLQAYSIAWEDVDDEKSAKPKNKSTVKKSARPVNKISDENYVKGNAKKSQTYTKAKHKPSNATHLNLAHKSKSGLGSDDTCSPSMNSNRPNSSRSHSSVDRQSKGSKTPTRRPPSARSTGHQSPTTNEPQASLPQNKHQPNSDMKKKMSNLEAKPTRGVLLNRRSSSLTREGNRNKKVGAKKAELDIANKQTGIRSRSRSADSVNRKAVASVHATARKFENKQKRDRENVKVQNRWQEKQKQMRDEMAARHLEREKTKELKEAHAQELGCPVVTTPTTPVTPATPGLAGLENLVTVNILSPPSSKDPEKSRHSNVKNKTGVNTPTSPVKKSLRRVEPPKKAKITTKTFDLSSDAKKSVVDSYVVSTYKPGSADEPASAPGSGLGRDGEDSYTEIAGRVADIQLQIKRLKSQATNGDEMTLTLVSDLQDQLQMFEHQLPDTEQTVQQPYHKQPQVPQQQQQWFEEKEREIKERHLQQLKINQNPPKPSPRKKVSADKPTMQTGPSPDFRPTPLPRKLTGNSASERNAKKSPQQAVIDEILAEDVSLRSGSEDEADRTVAMSKSKLLDEMRKEKHEHHRQIRMLQTELKRLKHSDPVSTMELNVTDIVYGEEDLLGEGVFSQVYRGQFQGTEVAVKCLKLPLQSRDRNYFSAEVSLLRELRHPRVVLLIGVCTAGKLPLMVLEYMSRGSLYKHLHDPDQAALDHAEYYRLARDVALGMNYLHSHRPEVLHLDLKSKNILLAPDLRAKIADFGFSKLRHEAGSRGKAHPARSAPSWMAPELLDKGEVTSKADVYSFAIILWEMVTRETPYENCSVFQVLEMVRKSQRPKLPSTCPPGLSQLISKCWDQNPAKRPHFKDIIPALDNLAFPPAWQALLKEAGVPDEALHNVESTRKILSLVTDTLGTEDSKMLQSFILPQTNSQSLNKMTDSKAETETNETSLDLESDIFEISERPSQVESEFTLRNLGESSTESDSSRAVSETDSDDDYSILSSEMLISSIQTKTPQKTINVFVPSLNLEESIKTTREDFHSERGKIETKSNWLCISLDDEKTDRETDEINKSPVKSPENSGKILTRNRTVTPINLSADGVSYQERMSPSSKAKEYNIKGFLRMESIDNRRPNSPKKRISLTKRLAERPSKCFEHSNSVASSQLSTENDHQYKDDLLTKNSVTDSRKTFDTERSFDSFFGISVNVNLERKVVERQTSVEQNPASSCHGKLSFGESSACDDNETCVNDAESKNMPEIQAEHSVHSESDLLDKTTTSNTDSQCSIVDNKISEAFCQSNVKVNAHIQLENVEGKEIAELGQTDKATSSEKLFKDKGTEHFYDSDMAEPLNNAFDILAEDSDSTPRNIPSIVTTPRNFDPSVQSTPRDADISASTTPRNVVLITPGGVDMSPSTTPRSSILVTPRDMDKSPSTTPRNSVLVTPRDMDTSSSNTPRSSILITPRNLLVLEDSYSPSNTTVPFPSQDKLTYVPSPKTNDSVIITKDVNSNLDPSESKRDVLLDAAVIDSKVEHKFKNVSETDNDKTKNNIRVTLDLTEITNDKKPVTPRKSKDKYIYNKEVGNCENNSDAVEPIRECPFMDKMTYASHFEKDCNEIKTLNENLENTKFNSEVKISAKRDAGDNNFGKKKSIEQSKRDYSESQKKKKIRVKLRKDPLAPKLMKQPVAPKMSSGAPSPVPPAPPPPPAESLTMSRLSFSRSVQEPSPGMSIVDELRLRLSTRKSYAEGMKINRTVPKRVHSKKQTNTPTIHESGPYSANTTPMLVPGLSRLVPEEVVEGELVPAPSDGIPQFAVQSMELQDQRDLLRSISKTHPDQLDDLSSVSQEQLMSIADILRKAMTDRRLTMGEDAASVSQSLDSVSWSIDTG